MKKTKRDFTVGNPSKAMLIFAAPLIASMILQNLYHAADTVIVGRYIGEKALAAVGTTASVSMLVLMLISGATDGISVIISQYYGAREDTQIKKTVVNGLYLIVSLSLIFGILGSIFSRQLLTLIRVPTDIIADAVTYLQIIFIGSIVTALYNMANAISRSMGDSMTPLIVLMISSLLNIILNITFVTKFHMGVAGVAYATVIATVLSAIICWAILLYKMPMIRFWRDYVNFDSETVRMIIRIGLPSSLRSSTMAFGNLFMQNMINSFGAIVMAAFNVGVKVENLIANPPGGITQAMQVFSGQNVGAGKFERVKKGFKDAIIIISCYCIVSALILIFAGENLISIFSTKQGDMIEIGRTYLVIAAFSTYFCGMAWLTKSTLIGAGDAAAGLYVSMIELVTRVVFAFVLSKFTSLGFVGIFVAAPISYVASGIFGLHRYYKQNWMRRRLVKGKER